MIKKMINKLRGKKDIITTKDNSIQLEITTPWISTCMANSQRDSIDRLKRAKRDLSL